MFKVRNWIVCGSAFFFLFFAFMSSAAHAGIFDSLKKEAEKAVQGDSGSSGSGGGAAPASQPASSAVKTPASNVTYTPDSSGLPPGLMFSTVLNGVLLDWKKGVFKMNQIQAVFLPKPSFSGTYPYDPTRGGGELYTLLKNSSGKLVARFDWYASVLKAPYWLLGSYEWSDAGGAKGAAGGGPVLGAGKYTLEFYAAGKKFYVFPFQVSKVASKDPFKPGDGHYLDGDWENWGYLYYSEANPERNLEWKFWLRDKTVDIRGKDAKIDVTISKGGKVIVESNPATYNIKPTWIRFAFGLSHPKKGTSGGAYFKAKDLLAKDGSYVLTVKIDKKTYGSWKFNVKGGKLVYGPRTQRGASDPLTFIEGGRDAWWYGK